MSPAWSCSRSPSSLLHGPLLRSWTGGIFERPEVELVASEGRHYVRSHDDRYDILQITAVDTFSAQTTGAYVLAESYLYTVEAFQDYLSHLTDDGVLSIVIGDIAGSRRVPPPHATRLALVAREALRRRGAADPQAHIMLVARPFASLWSCGNLLVKRSPFTPEEVAARARVHLWQRFRGSPGSRRRRRFGHHSSRGRSGGGVGAAVARRRLCASVRSLMIAPSFFMASDGGPSSRALSRLAKNSGSFPARSTGQLMLLIMLGQALLVGGALIVLPLARRGLGQLPLNDDARLSGVLSGARSGFSHDRDQLCAEVRARLGLSHVFALGDGLLAPGLGRGGRRAQPPRLEPSATIPVRAPGRHRRAGRAGRGGVAGFARTRLGGLPAGLASP